MRKSRGSSVLFVLVILTIVTVFMCSLLYFLFPVFAVYKNLCGVEKTLSNLSIIEQKVNMQETYLLKFAELAIEKTIADFKVEIWEATAYAPLDPNAKKGMCYSGDPNITASGELILPGVSVAAGKNIPFGTWIWVEGCGWRRVDDRGGRIKDRQVDICCFTQEEAINWGRRKVVVVIPMNSNREVL